MKTFEWSTLPSFKLEAILLSAFTYCISPWGSSHLLSKLSCLCCETDTQLKSIYSYTQSTPQGQMKIFAYLYKKKWLEFLTRQAYYELIPT